MKHWISRILAVTLTMVLLLVAIPVSPALAVVNRIDSMIVSASSGEVGDTVTIRGEGNNGTIVKIYFSNQNFEIGASIDTDVTTYKRVADLIVSFGNYYTGDDPVEIPSLLTDGDDDLHEMHGGTYYFYLTMGTSKIIIKKATFILTGIASITTDETQGIVGTEVSIAGVGYASGEFVTIQYDGIVINDSVFDGSDKVNSSGAFYFTFPVPPSVCGTHTITVIGEDSLAEYSVDFDVVPSITLSATSGKAGATIIVIGKGFARLKYVDIYIGSTKWSCKCIRSVKKYIWINCRRCKR